ncbi:MAG: AAA family ATPase [Bacteroidota bacterium]
MIGQAERLLELNRLKAQSQQQSKPSKKNIIAFSSGKGGTGKTFVSLNTAYALSKLNRKVLLVDLDANLSNVNIMLNIKSEKTIINFFLKRAPLNSLVSQYSTNLHFIFGDSGRADYPVPGKNELDLFIHELRELSMAYDYVVLDIGAGAGEDIIQILKNADRNIVIINPEPTAIMDAYVIIKSLHNAGYTGDKHVVVNKCLSSDDGITSFNNLSKAATHFLKERVSLLGIIEHDAAVTRAIMSQELLLKINPRSKAALQILRVTQNLLKILQMANNHQSHTASY